MTNIHQVHSRREDARHPIRRMDTSTICTDILAHIWSLLANVDKLVIKDDIIYSKKICKIFTIYGYLTLLQQANYDVKLSLFDICTMSAGHGHIHILQWLLDTGNLCNGSVLAAYTISNGQLETLQWVLSNTSALIGDVGDTTILCGHLHIIQWMLSIGHEWNNKMSIYAANYGHVHILQWIVINGYECDIANLSFATEDKRIQFLEWAIANKYY